MWEGWSFLYSKVHGTNMGPIWVLSAPDGPHVAPINIAIRVIHKEINKRFAFSLLWFGSFGYCPCPWGLFHWHQDCRAMCQQPWRISFQWRHNGHGIVSNHQPHDCLPNRLFRRTSKKTLKLRVTGLCAANSPGTVNSPHKWPVTRKMLPFDDVIMWMKRIQGSINTQIITKPKQSTRNLCP